MFHNEKESDLTEIEKNREEINTFLSSYLTERKITSPRVEKNSSKVSTNSKKSDNQSKKKGRPKKKISHSILELKNELKIGLKNLKKNSNLKKFPKEALENSNNTKDRINFIDNSEVKESIKFTNLYNKLSKNSSNNNNKLNVNDTINHISRTYENEMNQEIQSHKDLYNRKEKLSSQNEMDEGISRKILNDSSQINLIKNYGHLVKIENNCANNNSNNFNSISTNLLSSSNFLSEEINLTYKRISKDSSSISQSLQNNTFLKCRQDYFSIKNFREVQINYKNLKIIASIDFKEITYHRPDIINILQFSNLQQEKKFKNFFTKMNLKELSDFLDGNVISLFNLHEYEYTDRNNLNMFNEFRNVLDSYKNFAILQNKLTEDKNLFLIAAKNFSYATCLPECEYLIISIKKSLLNINQTLIITNEFNFHKIGKSYYNE